jgi:hypothetical protein
VSGRFVLFAAVYGSAPPALDGLRVLTSAAREEVAGPGLLHRDVDGRTTLERASGSRTMRAALLGLAVGLAAGLGTSLMWTTALIGAAIGWIIGYHDRTTEVREWRSLVGELVPPGGCALVAVTAQDLATRLSQQFDLAQATCMIPISGRRMAELARCLSRGNADVTRALDSPEG